MATVKIEDTSPVVEREVIREPVAVSTGNGGGTAAIIATIVLLAVIALGAYLYWYNNGYAPSPTHMVTTVEKGVDDAGNTVKKTVTQPAQ